MKGTVLGFYSMLLGCAATYGQTGYHIHLFGQSLFQRGRNGVYTGFPRSRLCKNGSHNRRIARMGHQSKRMGDYQS